MKLNAVVEGLVTLALLIGVYTETGIWTTILFVLTIMYMEREILDEGYKGLIDRFRNK